MKGEKWHAVVAPCAVGSQQRVETDGLGPRLEIKMLKRCTVLRHEARFQFKMYEVEMLKKRTP